MLALCSPMLVLCWPKLALGWPKLALCWPKLALSCQDEIPEHRRARNTVKHDVFERQEQNTP